MQKARSVRLVVWMVTLLAIAAGVPSWATSVTSLKSAKHEAEKNDLPILIKIGTEWSPASGEFDEAVDTDTEIQTALEGVILFAVDAGKGVGVDVAKSYPVHNYPTFILTDRHGETIDRWYGFGCRECFVKALTTAVEDPITVGKRLKRFQKEPSETDARKLGDIRHSEGMFAEAAAFYRRADDLNPASEANYDGLIFNSMAYGNYYQIYSADQVRAQAEVVLASDRRSDKDQMKVAYSMGKVSKRAGDLSYFLPYLKVAIEETADSEDEKVVKMRKKLLPDYALHITKDVDQAIAHKKAAQPEGWLEEANLLNNFAWWCFKNEVNLEEADRIARKGIELAKPGREKANILDTLAEICNLTGECEDAVKYVRMAAAEDPENEYFQRQLSRFEEILAAQR